MICDGVLGEGGECGNPLCRDGALSRGWKVIYAVAMRSGTLQDVISRYKYDGLKGWAWIFARVLVGYLEQELLLDDWDLIIPMPTFVGGGGRDWDHIDLVLERALVEDPDLPVRRDVMRKVKATPRLVGQSGFAARALVAETHIYPALEITDPRAVAGMRVLVFDDVFTSGLTLREVAQKLKQAGALSVGGIVLARQPFRGA
jgi:predicted amidophosphoribosyltransferase